MNALVRVLRQDLRVAVRHLWLNVVAGSVLVPRPLRTILLRVGGLGLARTANVAPGCTFTGTNVRLGGRAFLNRGCYLEAASREGDGWIHIGAGARLGPEVMVLTSHHDLVDGKVSARATRRNVVIGEDAWLGARVVVLPGARIGPGVVVGAGAVVSGELAGGAVYAGVPARWVRDLGERRVDVAWANGGRTRGIAVWP